MVGRLDVRSFVDPGSADVFEARICIRGEATVRLIHIHIPAWSKFNPRKDRANYTWFRFENDFFQDHKLFGLSDSQIILFQMLVCEASKKNKDSIEVNLELIATYRRTTADKITKDLQELISRGVIVTANDRLNDGEQPTNSLTTRRTNETNGTVFPRAGALPDLVSNWNTNTKRPKIKDWSETRKRKFGVILERFGEKAWSEALAMVERSDFLAGRTDRWVGATFDWLINPANFSKVIEGNYENHGKKKTETKVLDL